MIACDISKRFISEQQSSSSFYDSKLYSTLEVENYAKFKFKRFFHGWGMSK